MTKEPILDEVPRAPHEEQLDVLQRLVDMVAPPLTADQEQGIADALDEAEAGGLVDGPEAFERVRASIRSKRASRPSPL
jgi:hypothetical protein